MNAVLIVLALALAATSAFTPAGPALRLRRSAALSPGRLRADADGGDGDAAAADESWPSDCESDDTATVAEVVDATPPADAAPTEVVGGAAEAEKQSLLATLPISATGELDDASRAAVTELVLALEKLNTVAAPATDPLLNGRWELLYSGGQAQSLLPSPTRQIALFLYAGGYTPGMFALKLASGFNLASVGSVTVTIARDQPRVESEASVRVGSADTVAKVACLLEAESSTRLRETYESFEAYGQRQDIPDPLKYSRTLYVTYLDDELLITRDASGAVDILRRSDMVFSSGGPSGEGVPSAADDDLSPGAG